MKPAKRGAWRPSLRMIVPAVVSLTLLVGACASKPVVAPSDSTTPPPGATTSPTTYFQLPDLPDPVDVSSVGAIVEETTDLTLHVSQAAPNAADTNDGSADSPFLSIGAALVRAAELRSGGLGVRVVVGPGIYRESLAIEHIGEDAPVLVVEAEQPGTAVISGADVWSDWLLDADRLVHEWPFDWGEAEAEGWDEVDVPPIVTRREVVFVNGVRLTPVLSAGDLSPGTFYVDEDADRVYVGVESGVDPADVTIEVAVRTSPLTVAGAENGVVRGFVFTRAANLFDSEAVYIFNAVNFVFDNNVVVDNSWTGLGVATSRNLTISNNAINENGGAGIGVFIPDRIMFEGNETSRNNWRGALGDLTGWSIAGVKMVGGGNSVFRLHRSIGNHTRGFWLDYDVRSVLIEDVVWCGNDHDGVFIEATPGPVVIRRAAICHNARYGLLTGNVVDLGVQGSLVCGNDEAEVWIGGDDGGREVEVGDETYVVPVAENLTFVQNTVEGAGTLLGSHVGRGAWSGVLDSLVSDANSWRGDENARSFDVPGAGRVDFAAWQELSGQDPRSAFVGRTVGSCVSPA